MISELTITKDVFDTLLKMREELDQIIETIEIMNDKELMEGINRALREAEEGKIHELKNIDNLL